MTNDHLLFIVLFFGSKTVLNPLQAIWVTEKTLGIRKYPSYADHNTLENVRNMQVTAL